MNRRTQIFRRQLLRWYGRHQRTLPWRRTRNPYRVLVSEIMLQQTQVKRVQKKYPVFLKRFPTLETLAKASNAQVILAWQGMGYNNRALRLRDLARQVLKKHGRIPDDVKRLMDLPGIGRYTAHAITSLAFGKREPVVDVNVQRVFSRVFWKMRRTDEMKDPGVIWKLAEGILPPRAARDWNQALMDFGATVCTSRPRCNTCPMTRLCASYPTLSGVKGRATRESRETLYDGLPVRIYRGRIVEILRRINGKGRVEVGELGRLIKPAYTRFDLPWLTSILKKLEGEGLAALRRERDKTVVSLPWS